MAKKMGEQIWQTAAKIAQQDLNKPQITAEVIKNQFEIAEKFLVNKGINPSQLVRYDNPEIKMGISQAIELKILLGIFLCDRQVATEPDEEMYVTIFKEKLCSGIHYSLKEAKKYYVGNNPIYKLTKVTE